MGPIPWTALDAYARRYRIDNPQDFDRFVALVNAIDGVILAHWRKSISKAPDGSE